MANIENKDPKKDLKKRMVKALFSYTPVNSDELTLKINDILEVIEETEEGWWKGILDGNVGMFPSNFVIELDGYPDELNNKLMNELSPSKNSTKVKNVNQQEPTHRLGSTLLIQNKLDNKQGMMNSANADGIDGSSSSKSSTDPLPEKKLISSKKPSVDSSAPRLPPKPVREQARVIFPYESQNEDELSLKEGDIITVLSKEIEDKGWWRGELNNRIGVFPDNFVKLIKAEEQKKPERPDKPPAVIASKNSLKSVASEKGTTESSPKSNKKVLKTPPAKPPPPEIHKKEPDRPLPPCPSKKPQSLPPAKKPSRSSLGPKLPAAPAVISLKSPTSESSPSIPTSRSTASEKTEGSSKVEDGTDKESKHKKEELEFAGIEPCSRKLVHLTANRAKAPNRRPPSFIFLKDSEKDRSTSATDSRRLSEPLLTEFKPWSPLTESQKTSAISASNVEIKPKVPPSRPALPATKSNSFSKQDIIISSKKESKNEDSAIKLQETVRKEVLSEKVPILTKEVLQPKVAELPPPITPKVPFFKIPSADITTPELLPSQLASKVSSPKIPPSVASKASSNSSAVAPSNVVSAAAVAPTITAVPSTITAVPSTVTAVVPSTVAAVVTSNVPIEVFPATPSKTHHIVTKPPATIPAAISSNGTASLETQVLDIKDDLKLVMNNMVSKNEYNALLKQVNELKVILETYNKNCNKAISDLKEELNEERRLRCTVELELQKLKECQKT